MLLKILFLCDFTGLPKPVLQFGDTLTPLNCGRIEIESVVCVDAFSSEYQCTDYDLTKCFAIIYGRWGSIDQNVAWG